AEAAPPKSSPAPQVIGPEQADAVVCAAADLLDVPPRQVRPILEVAFARAHKLGYSTEALALAFAARPKAAEGKESK
ncbi:MAG: hypothetical protein ACYCWW_20965, partial [Deltaproteobacteria bacterium]